MQDAGGIYRGLDEIESWITHVGGVHLHEHAPPPVSAPRARIIVHIPLDGNLPGNTVLLRYQFELADGLVMDLSVGI